MAGSMPSDPEILAFIDRTEAFYPADAASQPVEKQREFYNALCADFRGVRPDDISVTDDTVQSNDPDWAIPVRIYQHKDRAVSGTALLYIHGGGFVVGGLESHDDLCGLLCHETGVTIVAVDYRLAPEHVYPAQLDDVACVYDALRETYERVLAGGDSAGGCLAAALCVDAVDLKNAEAHSSNEKAEHNSETEYKSDCQIHGSYPYIRIQVFNPNP
ncbi:alpha/beta hydrolase [Coralliovum pocilloporae]|uniref:alpha/beta hydrolase n=1 Tax=Coralliovum pocilloporae TaxID=3066369 RepID=UPI003307227A